MPRRLRKDHAGAWHHIVNRGIAKRTLFETRRDVRQFLACIAREVRRGDLEVHAFAILTTHFHLLVRSPRGRLSAAMQRAEDAYARWFNIGRRRDGPLFRGRFWNGLVDSDAYWFAVLRYIDRNPVEAGLCRRPVDYPHGSAWHYARPRGPRWLSRRVVESEVGKEAGGPRERSDYAWFSGESLSPGQRWVAERRARLRPAAGEDPLAELLPMWPGRVRAWMERKALLADGTSPGWVLVDPGTVQQVLLDRRSREPARVWRSGHRTVSWWELAEAGSLRWMSGLRLREIEKRLGRAKSTVFDRLRLQAEAMQRDAEFREEMAAVLAEALERDHGRPGERGESAGPAVPIVASGPVASSASSIAAG